MQISFLRKRPQKIANALREKEVLPRVLYHLVNDRKQKFVAYAFIIQITSIAVSCLHPHPSVDAVTIATLPSNRDDAAAYILLTDIVGVKV